jgi:SAM-dependent methyltransferase
MGVLDPHLPQRVICAAVILIPITARLLEIGCALTLTLNDSQALFKRLHIPDGGDIDLSGQVAISDVSFGFTTTDPGLIGRYFAKYNSTLQPRSHVMDVGAAWYGVNTIPALRAGHIVHAVDSRKELSALAARAKQVATDISEAYFWEEWSDRLKLHAGRIPERYNLSDNSIDSIMIGSVLHFLTPEEVHQALVEAFRVLKPGGKIFLEAQTPYMRGLDAWRRVLWKDRSLCAENLEWPWQIHNENRQFPTLREIKYINLFDITRMRRALKQAGFTVEEIGYFARLDFPESKEFHGDDQTLRKHFTSHLSSHSKFETVGAVAKKPWVWRPDGN